MNEERYVDCDICGERYVGEDAIRSYIREKTTPNGIRDVCISCNQPQRLKKPEAALLKDAAGPLGTWLVTTKRELEAARGLRTRGLVTFDGKADDETLTIRLTPKGKLQAQRLGRKR